MKTCAKCGGSMKKGGTMKKMAKGGVQKIVGMPGYNATLYPTSFKKGGPIKTKKYAAGGTSEPEPNPSGKSIGNKLVYLVEHLLL
jgi:hypothetical protein